MSISIKELIAMYVRSPWIDDAKSGNVFIDRGILYSYGHHFPLMLKLGDYFLINGDTYSVTTSKHTMYCNREAGDDGVAIPFSALRAAGIPVDYLHRNFGLEILDKKEPTWETKTGTDKDGNPVEYQVHTLGASVIRYNTGGEWRYFLSGVDATGTGRGAYFLTELMSEASTVDEAFEQLKPLYVKNAETMGWTVLRQGEYFFIPTKLPAGFDASILKKKIQKQYALVDKDNRRSRHIATEGFVAYGITYVRGTIRHERKEHKMLKLGKDWYSVHENTQKASFSAGGGFD